MAGTLTEIIDNGGLRSQREGINSDLTRVFKVAGLTGGTGAEAETEAISGFPADNSTYGIAPYANLRKFSHSFEWQNTAKTEGLVTVRYRTPSNTRTQTGSPGDRSPIITWGTQLESRPLLKDFTTPTAKVVVNTAGQPFDPPPTTLVGVPYVEVTVWKTSSQFTGTVVPLIAQCPIVNSGSFTIDGVAFSARKLLATVERAEKEFEDTETYYRVSYRFLINNDTWDLKLLSYGYYENVGGEWKPIVDTEGSLVTRPYPLAPDGTKESDPSNAGTEMTFLPYRVVSFTGLF
jgi:hypothetical protein